MNATSWRMKHLHSCLLLGPQRRGSEVLLHGPGQVLCPRGPYGQVFSSVSISAGVRINFSLDMTSKADPFLQSEPPFNRGVNMVSGEKVQENLLIFGLSEDLVAGSKKSSNFRMKLTAIIDVWVPGLW